MSSSETSCDDPVYRRIPVKQNYYKPETDELNRYAFNPNKNDTDGLSISIGRSDEHPDYLTLEEFAALGSNPQGYFVAELSLSVLGENNVTIKEDRRPEDPGHCLIPELTYPKRRTPESVDLMNTLCEFTVQVHGPFFPSPDH